MELLEEILSNDNMNNAYKQVYQNKGASGIDGISIEDLAYHLRKHKDDIRNQIRKRKYKPMPALRVEIPKDNGKMRKLGIPTVVDRVIQQAISQKQKFQRKLKQLTKRNQGISLTNRIVKLRQVIYGWVNYFKIAKIRLVASSFDVQCFDGTII